MSALVTFVVGLALLVVGAEIMVSAAARLATSLGIAPMVIGLTIVSIGTSTPELAVGIAAGFQGAGGLAVGNIAGANVFVLLFVLGLSAVMRPLPLHLQIFKLELPMIVVAAALLTMLAWDGRLSRIDGILMLSAGLFYSIALVFVTRKASRQAKREFSEEYGPESVAESAPQWKSRLKNAALVTAGIILTCLGAELLVQGAVCIARSVGVSATTIGLTIVAFGTSSPELVTTIVSTLKNDRDVAIGNLLGSAIYNILAILSIPCIIVPGGLPVERNLLWFDIPLMAGVALGAIPVFVTGQRVSRLEGGLGITIYVVYIVWLLTRG